ncbi:hypothetical protein ACLB2K_004894 [Fragaria x ananassa]
MSSLIPLRLLLPPLSPTITLQYPPFQLPSSKSSFKSFSSSYLPCAWNTTSSPSKRRKWLCGHMGRDQDIENRSTEDKSGVQMFGSDEEIGTQIPTQAQSIVEGSAVMVSEFRPAADVDYLQELLAIQQQGPRSIGFFGTRNMGFMHQELIEILSYAMVITKNHIYTSGASGTNAAVIRGALRAEKPELLTVILPQSLKKQPPESQELLSKVKNVIEKPHNDHLPLLEASRLCNMDIISHVQQVICFAFHDTDQSILELIDQIINMEGLIPLVFKAIKRNRSRQPHTRSLSIQTPYFFVDDDDDRHQHTSTSTAAAALHGSATQTNYLYITPPAVNILQNATTDHHQHLHHRRHKSVSVVGDRGYSFGIADEELDNNKQMAKVDDHQRPKPLVRFRSHRSSLFSCISGAV